jgi:hypothetical protein
MPVSAVFGVFLDPCPDEAGDARAFGDQHSFGSTELQSVPAAITDGQVH